MKELRAVPLPSGSPHSPAQLAGPPRKGPGALSRLFGCHRQPAVSHEGGGGEGPTDLKVGVLTGPLRCKRGST